MGIFCNSLHIQGSKEPADFTLYPDSPIMRTLLTDSILAIFLCTTATAAAAAPVSLEELMRAPGRTELRQGHADGEVSLFGTMWSYGNGDELISAFDVPIVISLCHDRGHLGLGKHLNIGAMLPGVAPTLSTDQRAGAIADIYLMLLHRAGTVLGVVGDKLRLPPAGKSVSVRRTTSSDYGDERYTVTIGHGIGGQVRVRVVKTAAAISSSDPGANAGAEDDDDGAAWLHEADPVGTWYEIVVSSAPQEAALPDGLSMKGWLSPNEAQYASVGEARKASSACTPSGDASVDQPPEVSD
jgi:hypothetical protein